MVESSQTAAFAQVARPYFVHVVDVDTRPHTLSLLQIADLRCWPEKYFHGQVLLSTGDAVDLHRDWYQVVRDAMHDLMINPGKPGPLPLRMPYRELYPQHAQDYLAAQKKLFGAAADHRLDNLDREGRLAFASEVFDENVWSWRCLTPEMMDILRAIIEANHVQPGWARDGLYGYGAEALMSQ